MIQKAVYPYEYIDSWNMFDDKSFYQKCILQQAKHKRYKW